MNYTNLEEYFDKYIKNYAPYRGKELYDEVIEYLKSYYFKDTYCAIPRLFKNMYELSVIDPSTYDVILGSAGFPKELLDKLTTTDKQILIQSFLDYQKYNYTVYFIQKIAELFHNHVNIYELWVDYDGEWCFVPKLIYAQEDYNQTEILNYKLNYDYIYAKAKKFYLSKHDLQRKFEKNEIILPFKTNLLLLDYFVVYDTTKAIDTLIINTILSQLYYEEFNLQFSNVKTNLNENVCVSEESITDVSITPQYSTKYTISVIGWYQLYYYVFHRYYNSTFYINPLLHIPIEIPSPNFEYDVQDLIDIKNQYNSIRTSLDAKEFFYRYIREPFLRQANINNEVTIDDLELILRSPSSNISNALLDYVDDIFSDKTNLKHKVVNLLDDLKNALVTFIYQQTNEDYKTYLQLLLDSMPTVLIPLDETVTYLMIREFKPFHTQLLEKEQYKVVSNDRLNIIKPIDTVCQSIKSEHATSANISDDNLLSITSQFEDQELITDACEFNVVVNQLDDIIEDNSQFLLKSEYATSANISDDFNIIVNP